MGCRALVIHLEDHEEAIFERFTGLTVAEAMAWRRSGRKA